MTLLGCGIKLWATKIPLRDNAATSGLATSLNAFADFFPGLAAGGGQARSPLPALGNCRPRPADYGPCFQPRLPHAGSLIATRHRPRAAWRATPRCSGCSDHVLHAVKRACRGKTLRLRRRLSGRTILQKISSEHEATGMSSESPRMRDYLEGLRRALPIMLGYVPVGFAFGVLAVKNNIPPRWPWACPC